jgi:hypothetical protein
MSPANLARLLIAILIAVEAAVLMFGPDVAAAKKEIAEAVAANQDTPWEADADIGIHYAAWINLALLVVLLATAQWWTRPFQPSPLSTQHSALSTPPWFWPGVFIAITLCLLMRMPLASQSLWWDEAWVVRQCTHGSWKEDKAKPGELKFSPTSWKRCVYYYQKPTNHVPMSLAQKASLDLWHHFTDAKKHEFSELAMRAPALIASSLAMLLIALLGRSWGRPVAGWSAALLLALHPWHTRYGVDARAYALVVPLAVSALLASTRLLNTGGRSFWCWVWLSLNQFVWLWAYPNALLDIAVLFVILAVLLWREHRDSADRFTALSRLVITHAFSAMLLLQAFLPCFMQARHWAGQEADKHLLTAELARETASQVLLGTPWRKESPPFPLMGASAEDAASHLLTSNPLARWLLLPALLLASWGLWSMRHELRGRVWLAWSLLISSALFASLTRIADSYFYPRFIIAIVPVVMFGLAWNATREHGPLLIRATRWLASLALLVLYFVVTNPPRTALSKTPISPLRDVAEFLTKATESGPEPLVACYGLGREAMPVYYPKIASIESKAEIEALFTRAKSESRPFYLVQGYDGFNRVRLPDGFEIMDDATRFEIVATFPGIESDFWFRVLRAK